MSIIIIIIIITQVITVLKKLTNSFLLLTFFNTNCEHNDASIPSWHQSQISAAVEIRYRDIGAPFHCSDKTGCNAVWTAEPTHGRLATQKLPSVKGCECKRPDF